MAWNTILASIGGAIIGASIASYISYRIYRRQNLMNHYLEIASKISEAFVLSRVFYNKNNKEDIRSQVGLKINILLNQVYSYALTSLPDNLFKKLNKIFPQKGTITDADINQLYLELRKVLYKRTKIEAQDIITKKINVISELDLKPNMDVKEEIK